MGGRENSPREGALGYSSPEGWETASEGSSPDGMQPQRGGTHSSGPWEIVLAQKKGLLLDFFMADSCVSHIDVLKNGLALAS